MVLSVNVSWEDDRLTELEDSEGLVGCAGLEDGGVELENGVELGDGVELGNEAELEDEVELGDGVDLDDGVTSLHVDASVYEGLTELGAVRLMVSFTDRGDDILFPISFIISVLPGTQCTTSDSILLLLLLSDIVYLWKKTSMIM